MTAAAVVPTLTHICDLEIELSSAQDLGESRAGRRRVIPITGGRASGRIAGRLLPLGADWQTTSSDGASEIDARQVVETDDGALIEIVNRGVRYGALEVLAALAEGEAVDPARYYFRTSARFTSGDPGYDWVNRLVFVGSGARLADKVAMTFYAVE